MEAMYSSVGLDVIGKAVFNYDFASVRSQSDVIDAVYGLMQEAEHRYTDRGFGVRVWAGLDCAVEVCGWFDMCVVACVCVCVMTRTVLL